MTVAGVVPGARRHRFALAMLGVATAAALLIWWAMSHGPGVNGDSVIYMGTAKSVLAGRGLVFDDGPVTHFPPGYPLMIAAITLFTHDATRAAQLLAAIWFGVNILLVGWAVRLASGRSVTVVMITVLMFAVSGPVLYWHAEAMSEAPFIGFVLGGLLALSAWATDRRAGLLVLAAALFGLAMVTRYVGVVLLAPLAVAVLLLGERPVRVRIRDLAVAGAIALTPLVACMIRNRLVAQSATDRTLKEHLVSGAALLQGMTALNDYLLPVDAGPWIKGVFVVAVALTMCAGLLAAFHRNAHAAPAPTLARTLSLLGMTFVVAYAAFVLFSVSYVDSTTPLDARIFLPVFGVIIVAMAVLARDLALRFQRPAIWWGFAACAAASIAIRIPAAANELGAIHRDGQEYTSEMWRQSDLLAQVRRLPPALGIYSNLPDVVEFRLGRRAEWLPGEQDWESMQPNPAYPEQLARLCSRVISGDAVVAYFTTDGLGNDAGLVGTGAMCAFPVVTRRADGALFSAQPR